MLNSVLLCLPQNVSSDQTTIAQEDVICDAERNDTWTMGLIYCNNSVNPGYTLFSPMSSDITYLIDIHGREVHSWESPGGYRPALSAYLLEDGDVLRTANLGSSAAGSFSAGGTAGRVERISWDGELEWYWEYSDENVRSHHDIEPMPNGNFLMIAWESKSEAEATQAGRDPSKMKDSTLWPDHIIEVQPIGSNDADIVWEWHAWDHLIQDYDSSKSNYGTIADHPELFDINFVDITGPKAGGSDWMHCNGIDYNQVLDQIAFSCKNMNEIYIIDHSTTTLEASGHTGGNSGKGGDILYRWGNPESYAAGTSSDQQLFAQHDIQWIEEGRPGEGNLIVYNNGQGRGYSSADVIDVPVVSGSYPLEVGNSWGPGTASWTWDIGTDMYATSISGVERLTNGNTLITYGPKGTFYEVNLDGETVWKYINPKVSSGELHQGESIPEGGQQNSYQNNVFKVRRYAETFPGLVDKNLTPGDYLENWDDACPNEESIPWDRDGDGCLDDSDEDGVPNQLDQCEGFDDNIDVDSDGIPDSCDSLIDSDGDGVAKDLDECEWYDDNIDVDSDGIPDGCDSLIDTDGDGVANHLDSCEGYDDNVDNDTDGIPDSCDSLIDSDGDGVTDGDDLCPNTIEGVLVNVYGCSYDDDGDGIPNTQDECPNHFGYSEHLGCGECLPGPDLIQCPCGSSVGWEGMCTCTCNDEGMLEGHMQNGTFGTPWVEDGNESEDNNTAVIDEGTFDESPQVGNENEITTSSSIFDSSNLTVGILVLMLILTTTALAVGLLLKRRYIEVDDSEI